MKNFLSFQPTPTYSIWLSLLTLHFSHSVLLWITILGYIFKVSSTFSQVIKMPFCALAIFITMIGTMGKPDSLSPFSPLNNIILRVLRFFPLRFWSLIFISIRLFWWRIIPSLIPSKVTPTYWYNSCGTDLTEMFPTRSRMIINLYSSAGSWWGNGCELFILKLISNSWTNFHSWNTIHHYIFYKNAGKGKHMCSNGY